MSLTFVAALQAFAIDTDVVKSESSPTNTPSSGENPEGHPKQAGNQLRDHGQAHARVCLTETATKPSFITSYGKPAEEFCYKLLNEVVEANPGYWKMDFKIEIRVRRLRANGVEEDFVTSVPCVRHFLFLLSSLGAGS